MNIIWTHSQWLISGGVVLAAIGIFLYFSYRRQSTMPLGLRWIAGLLKLLGCALIIIFILEPKTSKTTNPPGTNHWAILVDNSSSMLLQDQKKGKSRADQVQSILSAEPQPWEASLREEFMVKTYSFDTHLRSIKGVEQLSFDGASSALGKAIASLNSRYQNRPLAGVLVLTDGVPTDPLMLDDENPPIYPLVIAPEDKIADLSLTSLTVQETLFEDAPLIINVSTTAVGLSGEPYIISIHEVGGKKLHEEDSLISGERDVQSLSIQVKPEQTSNLFLEARIQLKENSKITEATLANNTRITAINRYNGPYRVLYLGGRPNFEHKFLKRALAADPAIKLTSLLRIARREPKFDYRSRAGEKTNPLYRGFEQQEEAERFDEAVFLRLNTKYPGELAGGFPRTAEELFPFEAIIIDDLEAEFFDREQMRLLQRYVSERGGSLLMLGGMESLDTGNYAGTPIGELLPVYLEPGTPEGAPAVGRLQLTREGLLEPWVRLRKTEEEEKDRIRKIPPFSNIHTMGAVRPGAMEIAYFDTDTGKYPALAVRRYGQGRSAILAASALWRWGLQDASAQNDLSTTWRQLTRWLLADVPRPLSLQITEQADLNHSKIIKTSVLGTDFKPKEPHTLTLRVQRPNQTWTELSTTPSASKIGVMESQYQSPLAGTYLAEAMVPASEEQPEMKAQLGWTVNTPQDEYRTISPDYSTMRNLAEKTRGKVLSIDDLKKFISDLDTTKLPVTETTLEPLTHGVIWFLLALLCFIGEWALRRWKKLS